MAGIQIGFPFSVDANLGVGFASATTAGPGIYGGQSFQTIPLPNAQLALYRISIRGPNGGSVVNDYTFPISPMNISKEFTAYTNIYDVAGEANTAGVARVADIYGNSPVTYTIAGTTGWQRHSTDNYRFTGMESIAAIQAALNSFAALNAQQQASNNSDLYTMEFYDYFAQEFWQVVPVGRQVISQDQARPLLFMYQFRLAGIKNLNSPEIDGTDDEVLNALSVSDSQAISQLNISVTTTLQGYANFTAGALGELL